MRPQRTRSASETLRLTEENEISMPRPALETGIPSMREGRRSLASISKGPPAHFRADSLGLATVGKLRASRGQRLACPAVAHARLRKRERRLVELRTRTSH